MLGRFWIVLGFEPDSTSRRTIPPTDGDSRIASSTHARRYVYSQTVCHQRIKARST